MNNSLTRLVLIIDHPAQQFTRGLQILAATPGMTVTVLYSSVAKTFDDPGFDQEISWDVDLLGGYPWGAPKRGTSAISRMRWLAGELRGLRPDAIVCYGWASTIARMSIIFCLLSRTRILLYGDSTWQHSSRGWRGLARSAILRILAHVCTGAVSTGTFNREFYILHGMNPRRIWQGICPADTEQYGQARADYRMSRGQRGPGLRIGFAGKLIARKGVDELLHAAALLPPEHDWSVTVVGAGPLYDELVGMTAHLGLDARVTFHGFANATEMPKLLAEFDVVVVPSVLDLRTLVAIEAMAAGPAVIVSDATAIWGPGDLIEDGVTGLVYPSGDPAALAERLCRLLGDQELLARLQENGTTRAASFGPEPFARTMAAAIQDCIGKPSACQRMSETTGP